VGAFILRRLVQAVFTIFGVMLLTFVLFRLVTGDVSAQFVSQKAGREARIAWLHKRHLDLPLVLNFQRRIAFEDTTEGPRRFTVADTAGARITSALLLRPVTANEDPNKPGRTRRLETAKVQLLDRETSLKEVTDGERWIPRRAGAQLGFVIRPVLEFRLRDGTDLRVDLSDLATEHLAYADPNATTGEFLRAINGHPDNNGKLVARITEIDWSLSSVFNSQFAWHLRNSVTFQSRSYKTDEKLLDIIAERGKYSLALTVPAMALGWLTAMVVSSLVAYYRGGLIDKLGVFLSVLGMCVPYLIYMIVGQAIIFEVAPQRAWGLANPANIFVPIGIAVIAGLGGQVRFYRTVILDEIHRDYVRTARAKGVPLPGILFRHVLKNCMLPILTSLVVSIPFLIMGSLLLENFFGIPGLGSLMVNSVSDRDVPLVAGLTFLTAVVYVLSLLLTDLLYAAFDPRIRLR
jgi:peptide/nickel transport system permease protein